VARAAYRTAFVACLIAVIGGSVLAWRSYPAPMSPQQVARAYFAALAHADAPAALGLGAVPPGPHEFLTGAVLREQDRIAPMRAIVIGDVVRSGDRARVGYRYALGFSGGEEIYSGTLHLVHTPSGWRLARAAVPTKLVLSDALERLTFAGTRFPSRRTLLFPGALPARFDNGYLRLDPATAAVAPTTGARMFVTVEPTALARARLLDALERTVDRCNRATQPQSTCPQASRSIVPGSLRGQLVRPLAGGITFGVRGAAGELTMTGSVTFAGRYDELGHDRVVRKHTGRLVLPVSGGAYPVAPLSLRLDGAG
jgi:hypothetical protein